MRVLNEDEANEVWRNIYTNFHFAPSIDTSIIPFKINMPYRVFALEKYWSDEQEKTVRDIMIRAGISEAYALDWQHTCFRFSTSEEIPAGANWYDTQHSCQVFFPSFYPDGDYHFFMNLDLSEGFLGHPWRKELWVLGEKAISAFDTFKNELNLREL